MRGRGEPKEAMKKSARARFSRSMLIGVLNCNSIINNSFIICGED
jgi:hypothetical protein